jgi:hypothetical protein
MIKFKIALYGVRVAFSADRAELIKYAERITDADLSDGEAFCAVAGRDVLIHATSLPNLCHECFHAGFLIMSYLGDSPSVDNHEASAYLAGYIFDHCHRELLPC